MTQRVAVAFAVASCVGLLAALLSGMAFEPFALIGGWGLSNGLVAAVIAFLAVLARGTRWPGVVARWLLVAMVGVVAYGLVWWTLATRTPLWSLEGAWLWPSAVAAVGGWLVVARWAWRGGSERHTTG